jgi:hypothetical protein
MGSISENSKNQNFLSLYFPTMKKLLPIFLIPLILLSSCSIDWNDEKDKKIAELEQKVQELEENTISRCDCFWKFNGNQKCRM